VKGLQRSLKSAAHLGCFEARGYGLLGLVRLVAFKIQVKTSSVWRALCRAERSACGPIGLNLSVREREGAAQQNAHFEAFTATYRF
jgi:hypothetical protein